VTAGKPEEEDKYQQKEIEDITFYIRNEMFGKSFVIDWSGIWIFGGFVVKEL